MEKFAKMSLEEFGAALASKEAVPGGGGVSALAGALAAALICYLVQSLFGLGLCLVVPIAWIYMGLICAPSEVMARAG